MADNEEARDRGGPGLHEEPILGHKVGFVAGVDGGALLVDFRGNGRGPIRARSARRSKPTRPAAAPPPASR